MSMQSFHPMNCHPKALKALSDWLSKEQCNWVLQLISKIHSSQKNYSDNLSRVERLLYSFIEEIVAMKWSGHINRGMWIAIKKSSKTLTVTSWSMTEKLAVWVVYDRIIHCRKVYDTMCDFVYDTKHGCNFVENRGVWHKNVWHKM